VNGYVILRQTDADALMEEWGDLDADPFWRPVPYVLGCRNQGAPFPEAPCGFCHEGPCALFAKGDASANPQESATS
jgi:hypothetical protein